MIMRGFVVVLAGLPWAARGSRDFDIGKTAADRQALNPVSGRAISADPQ